MPLNTKQSIFVQEYLIDLNATQAAIRAGYSENSARQVGSENLSKPDIQEAIQEAMAAREKRTLITQDRVLQELGRIAFLDIRKAFDEEGKLLAITEMPEDVARAISGMDLSKINLGEGESSIEISKKIKMNDKKGALELIGKHLKMFTEKREISGPDGGPIQGTVTFVPKSRD